MPTIDDVPNLLANPLFHQPLGQWFFNQAASGKAAATGGLQVTRDGPHSTPGVLQRITVEGSKTYTISFTLTSSVNCKIWVGDGEKRQVAVLKILASHSARPQSYNLNFRAPPDGRLFLGVLFGGGSPVGKTMCLHQASLSRQSIIIPPFKSERHDESPIVAGMATIPGREQSLKLAIDSILPQVDHLFIYLNNFDVPPLIETSDKITIFRSQDHGDLRDNGKFFALDHIDRDLYFFSIDDDIVYPRDYVWRMVELLIKMQLRAVVGVHGIFYPSRPTSFFTRSVAHFRRSLDHHVPVSTVGTGTAAFHTSNVRPRLSDFGEGGMADLRLGQFIKSKGIPAIAISRCDDWLRDGAAAALVEDIGHTLYHEAKTTAGPAQYLAETAPWGFRMIRSAIDEHMRELHPAAQMMLLYGDAVESGEPMVLEDSNDLPQAFYLAKQLGWTSLCNLIAETRLRSLLQGQAL